MYNFFKNIFGVPNVEPQSKADGILKNEFRNPIWGSDEYSDDEYESFRQGNGINSFPVLTNPIEMHKYFEQQMDELLKQFGMSGWGEEGPGNPGFTAAVEPKQSQSLRDSLLKPGFERSTIVKKDSDLDGKLNAADIGHLFNKSELAPPAAPQPQFFSKSVSIRTVRRADGSVETVRSVRDSSGQETVTTTVTDPPLAGTQDQSDIQLFKKFFPF